jgi:ribonucleoside-diphosphate reductase alpha chain
MQVKKRNGQLEELHYEKINKVLNWAVIGISDVNSSDVAMNAKLQLYDGISTDSIHEVLINSAVELISEENPNYQYVASSLLNYLIRKRLFNSQNDLPSLYELVKKNIKLGFYNSEFLDLYTEEEFNTINSYIKHDRDYLLTYSGLQQVIDKYLVKDRFNNQIFETPQYMWILISMYLFKHYPKDKRLKQVKSFYDDISKLKLNLSTPILSGVRTPMTQFSSCVLVEVGDNLDSIFASVQAVGKYTARKAGIGLHLGNIRSLGDKIRNGEVIHTGVVPFAKVFESTVKSCQQAGLRGGGATTYFPIWHKEIENIVVLKNNRGTDDNRVRKLDYGIQINKLFYNRLIKKQNITLFSPHDVPSLKEAFYLGNNEVFEKRYIELENDPSISKKSIPATELFNSIAKERLETGRIYIMNVDNVNNYGSFSIPVNMSNLCLTGDSLIEVKYTDINNESNFIRLDEFNNLFNSLKDNYYVKSYNTETNEVEFCLVTNSLLTTETDELIEITDEDTGYSIKCTPEHKIFTKNRGYVMAKDLLENDILVN